MPQPATPAKAVVDEQFLLTLGDRLHAALGDQGPKWPPPRTEPPSSIAIDLIYLYRCASLRIAPVGVDENMLLRDKLIKVERQCGIVLERREDVSNRVAAAKQIVRPEAGSVHSRVGAFFGGVGLAITFIQGPGAMLDLPEDAKDVGGVVVAGISHIIDGIAESVRPFAE